MTTPIHVPVNAYGILKQNQPVSRLEEIVEEVRHLGYAVMDAGYTALEMQQFSNVFDETHVRYVQTYGEGFLKERQEYETIRAPLLQDESFFLKLALNASLREVLTSLIQGKYILNQQNGIINPPQKAYNQGSWHRDLPYQHFVSSQPLAINALFCVDDFTKENGATFVLPASHQSEAFPSWSFVKKHAVQIEAKAGSFVLLDCMLFHTGGFNHTHKARRAVNHVYTIPFLKQQISLPAHLHDALLSVEEKALLGFHVREPASIMDYLFTRTILT